jgi:L-threonylcarbamoyladenylate synthase
MDEVYNLQEIVSELRKGSTILYPTDTIWGIGCDATNTKAVEKIYKVKVRDKTKSLIILVDSIEMLKNYVEELPEIAIDLMKSYFEPLTIIYPTSKNLAKNVVAEDGSVAIRIPHDDFCQKLLKEFGKPITSTSANISGDPSPSSFSKISPKVKEMVDYIVEYKHQSFSMGKASSIIRICPDGEIKIIRS